MRICFLIVVLAASILSGCRKDPYIPVSTTFYNTYAGSGDLIGRDVMKLNNGFIVCGFGNNQNIDQDFVLLKTDSMGGEISRHFVGTSGNDQCWSFTKASDGGYVISGWTDINDPGISNDVLVVKTDAEGNQLWSKTYGGPFNDLSTHIISLDNGYLISAIKGGNADENSWILRLDLNGDTLWTFTYGGNFSDGAMSVCDNHDGTYAITGYTNSSGNGSTDGYVMIMNEAGEMLQFWPFGTPLYEEPHSIEKLGDNWIVAGHAGTTDFHTHNVFIQYISSAGIIGKFLTYGDHEHEGAEDMQIFRGEIYIAARSASHDPLQDAFFLHLKGNGTEIARQWIGTANEDPAYGIYVDDFQVMMTGYAFDPSSGRKQLTLIRR